MPRKRKAKSSARAAPYPTRNGNGKGKAPKSRSSKQGPLGALVDLGADSIKGIGRGIMPGLFKTQMVNAPTNVGIVAPRALFQITANAQKVSEFAADRSVRITGCGLFSSGLQRYRTAGTNASFGAFQQTQVSPFPCWRGVSNMSIDPRLFQLSETFQFYAIRLLRFTYIPSTGTSGELAEADLALGISQDAQEFTHLPNPSQTQILEQNVSVLTPAWAPTTLSYEHHGTRVWKTDPANIGTIDDTTQCIIAARWNNLLPTVASPNSPVVVGKLYVEYVIDLYEPQPVEENGSYETLLPSIDNGDGTISGWGYQSGVIGEAGFATLFPANNGYYPDGYNNSISDEPTTPFGDPPIVEEMKVSLLSKGIEEMRLGSIRAVGKKRVSNSLSSRLSLLEASLTQPVLRRSGVPVRSDFVSSQEEEKITPSVTSSDVATTPGGSPVLS